MANYIVDFTDVNASPITIEEGDINITSTDVSLFGRIRLEYGELLNESLLHLLENYSCPENPASSGTPDLSLSHNDLLQNPTIGQFWYNSTTNTLNQWDGTYWLPIRGYEDVAANWGSIGNNQQLPKPVSTTTGYEFPYDECIWSVAPAFYQIPFSSVSCGTDSNAIVTMEYKIKGTGDTFEGMVNYLIIGIKGNNNLGTPIDPPPIEGVTPTPTPSVTVSPGTIPSPTPTPKPTSTPNPTATPTISLTPSTTPVAALGQSARLYMSPAVCDPGTPGPGGGTDTYNRSTCGQINKSAFEQSVYVSIQGLNGGVPPYTINFSNIYTAVLWFKNYEDWSVQRTYSGGSQGLTSTIRTDVFPGEIAYARLRLLVNDFTWNNDYIVALRVHGRVIVTDSIGTTKQWWIPASEDNFPTVGYVAGCPIGGTNLTNPGADGPFTGGLSGTITYWYASWRHYALCSECPDCII